MTVGDLSPEEVEMLYMGAEVVVMNYTTLPPRKLKVLEICRRGNYNKPCAYDFIINKSDYGNTMDILVIEESNYITEETYIIELQVSKYRRVYYIHPNKNAIRLKKMEFI